MIKYLLIAAISLGACKAVNKIDNSEQKTSIQSMKVESDCYDDRKTQETFENSTATVKFVSRWWMLIPAENRRWQPCELPIEFQKEGMSVIVSGELKEIRPTERRAGAPFKLTSIRAVD